MLAKLMLKARLEVFSHETTFETNQRQGGNLDLAARRIIGCRSVGEKEFYNCFIISHSLNIDIYKLTKGLM